MTTAVNASTTTTTTTTASPFESVDAFWRRHSEPVRDVLVVATAAMALAACTVVIAYVALTRSWSRSAINTPMIAFFMVSIVSMLNFIVSSSLRLVDGALMRSYCDVSGVLLQMTVVTGVMLECGYFLTILNELKNGGANDLAFPRRITVGAFVFNVFAVAISLPLLPVDPASGTRYSGTGEPWCWLPSTDDTAIHGHGMFLAMQVAFGYAITLITALCAVYSNYVLIRALRLVFTRQGLPMPRAVYFRVTYTIIFLVCWSSSALHRMLPDDSTRLLGRLQAFGGPFVVLANAITFLCSDGPLRKCFRRHDVDDRGADDTGNGGNGRFPFDSSSDAALRSAKSAWLRPLADKVNGSTEEGDRANSSPRGKPSSERPSVSILASHLDDDAGLERSITMTLEDLTLSHAVQAVHAIAAEQNKALARLYYDYDNGEYVAIASEKEATARAAESGAALQALPRIVAVDPSGLSVAIKLPQLEKPYVAVAFSLLAGYCDMCGFLTLDLFTAHVTGNFVTIGLSVVHKSSDIYIKLAALIVFGITVSTANFVQLKLVERKLAAARCLIGAQAVLLLISSLLYSFLGPFKHGDVVDESAAAFATGLTMVAGMAIQNLFQRVFLVGLPMTTLMTGNTTGFFVDLFLYSQVVARQRLRNAAMAIFAFVTGCVLSAAVLMYAPEVEYVFPPIVSLFILVFGWSQFEPPSAAK